MFIFNSLVAMTHEHRERTVQTDCGCAWISRDASNSIVASNCRVASN